MEIKFRGFSIENNCWIHGFYHEVEVEGIKYAYIFWQGESWNVDIKSVGMFTGAKDDNNTEIYSNDIIALNDTNFYITWDELNYMWGVQYCDKSDIECSDIYIDSLWHLFEDRKVYNVNIVGNTYENSNLIN